MTVTYRVSRGMWELDGEYVYHVRDVALRVPDGFAFDLASIPRPLWGIVAPFELSIVAPLLHDVLYRFEGELPKDLLDPWRAFSRREADRLLLEGMAAEGVPAWRLAAAYAAVRTCGRGAWQG